MIEFMKGILALTITACIVVPPLAAVYWFMINYPENIFVRIISFLIKLYMVWAIIQLIRRILGTR